MTKIATAGSILLLGLAVSAAAEAQTLVSAEDPAELVGIIQDLGFQAKLETDNVGDPVIRSSSNGVDFRIYFYECKNNKRCKSLHFSVGYDLASGSSLDAVQQWNADKRFASAYLDDESDPFLQMDINTEGGITQQNFENSFGLWQSLKGEFEQFIGWHDKPQRLSSAGSRDRGA
jgi:putative sensory transduction regulator